MKFRGIDSVNDSDVVVAIGLEIVEYFVGSRIGGDDISSRRKQRRCHEGLDDERRVIGPHDCE